MKTRKTNLKLSELKRKVGIITLMAFGLTHSITPVIAKSSMAAINSNPGMVGAMMAVANLNYSMRVAAENPQDAWRVQNVRNAMGLVPVALMGLSQEFMQNKLVNNDLSTVMGMLGGFVDQNAAKGYEKFLQKPDASMIPKLGKDFPQTYLAKAEAEGSAKVQSLAGNEQAPGKPATDEKAANPSSDLTQFKDELLDLGSFAAQKKLETVAPVSNQNLFGDEMAPRKVAQAKPEEVANPKLNFQEITASNPPTVSRGLSSLPEGKAEIPPPMLSPRELDSENEKDAENEKRLQKESESDAFFKKVGDSKEEEKSPASKKRKKLRDNLSFLPSHLRFFPLIALVEALTMTEAKAEPNAPPAPGGSCGGGGGGGGGKDDQQGAAAGAVIQALAGVMAIAIPAAIMADSDKKITAMTINGQRAITEIAAKNAKDLSLLQAKITKYQTDTSVQVATDNRNATQENLKTTIAEARDQREQAYALEVEKRNTEKDYNNKRIDLAVKQADAQENLNKEKLKADIALAGLSQGVNTVGSSQLSVARVTSASGQSYSAGSVGSQVAVANSGLQGPQLGSTGQSVAAASSTGQGLVNSSARGLASTKTAAVSAPATIPALTNGTAFTASQSSINDLKGAVQSVNASSRALYNKVLSNKVSGTSRMALTNAKRNGTSFVASNSVGQAMGTNIARGFARTNLSAGISRGITYIRPYQGDGGAEAVSGGHPEASATSFSFGQP